MHVIHVRSVQAFVHEEIIYLKLKLCSLVTRSLKVYDQPVSIITHKCSIVHVHLHAVCSNVDLSTSPPRTLCCIYVCHTMPIVYNNNYNIFLYNYTDLIQFTACMLLWHVVQLSL